MIRRDAAIVSRYSFFIDVFLGQYTLLLQIFCEGTHQFSVCYRFASSIILPRIMRNVDLIPYVTGMAEDRTIFNSLNEQQLMMVRLLKKPLHEEDFVQLRQLATKLVTARLEAAQGAWEMKNSMEERERAASGG